MTTQLKVKFPHGLGDCANFAHVMRLYANRDYDFKVTIGADKAIVLKPAGAVCTQECGAAHVHWHEPPPATVATAAMPWLNNKAAIALNVAPLPELNADPETLWRELCAVNIGIGGVLLPADWEFVDAFVANLPRPLILTHTIGNTNQASKSLTDVETTALYDGLLSRMDGTVLALDFDNRCVKHPGIKHMIDDWAHLSVSQLAALMYRADLLIGVDSGPLHLSRMTPIKSVGVWTNETNYPTRCSLPTKGRVNVVPASCEQMNRVVGAEFNAVEVARENYGDAIAHTAMRWLQ